MKKLILTTTSLAMCLALSTPTHARIHSDEPRCHSFLAEVGLFYLKFNSTFSNEKPRIDINTQSKYRMLYQR